MMNQDKDRLEEEAISLYSSVYQYALAKVKEREVAQEIAQTVMEVVIRKRHTLKRQEALKKWVKVIATNKINDHFRRLKRERERYVWEEDRTLITEIQDEEEDILEQLQKQEDVRDVLTALLELDEKYQTVLKLHLIYEKSISEIAEECNQSYHTIKTRYRRGMTLLRAACCKNE